MRQKHQSSCKFAVAMVVMALFLQQCLYEELFFWLYSVADGSCIIMICFGIQWIHVANLDSFV